MCCPWWQCHEAAVINIVYSIEQHVFLVARFYQTTSIIMILYALWVKLECRKVPSRSAINRAVNKFEMARSMINNKEGVIDNKNSVRTPGNVHCVEQVWTQNPKKFVKHLSQQLILGASLRYRIIKDDVKPSKQNSNAASPS
jgi:hypothetical protein